MHDFNQKYIPQKGRKKGFKFFSKTEELYTKR